MSAYKQFLASNIIITPFEVNKSFNFSGSMSSSYIDTFIGKNITSSLFSPTSEPISNNKYQRLIYNSIKELYYSNYLSSSYGDPINRRTLIPGKDETGDIFIGSPQAPGLYYNYLPTTLTFVKNFPTASDSIISVISIPSKYYGNYIKPKTFNFSVESGSFSDDGEGNIKSGSIIYGNIFYNHGIVTIFNLDNSSLNNIVSSSTTTCSFQSSITMYETQYKCNIRENEFNFTLNPSISSGSSLITSSFSSFYTPGQMLYDFATGSVFQPYITTIGLYNDDKELLAIAKLAQPLPLSRTTDINILINIDR
jgi:hypothetical protein